MFYRSYVRRNSVGGSGKRSPLEKQGEFGAPRAPSMRGMVEGDGGTVNGFWGMVPSRGMVKVGLIRYTSAHGALPLE